MLDLNLQTMIAELFQEIPDCISIFVLDNTSGNVIERATQSGNIAINTAEDQFHKLQVMAREALQANGEEKFYEIIISGKKQINLMMMLGEQKYLLWICAASSAKLGVVRYKLTKFISEIEEIL